MQKHLFFLLLLLSSLMCFSQTKTYQLSSHILDNSTGQPASFVLVTLEKMNEDKTWTKISAKRTNKEGRITEFLPYQNSNEGVYKLVFDVHSYFESKKIESFYPFIEIIFSIKGNEHFHVPLTLSPFGYSTYKGS